MRYEMVYNELLGRDNLKNNLEWEVVSMFVRRWIWLFILVYKELFKWGFS